MLDTLLPPVTLDLINFSKNSDFSKNCEKLEKSLFLLKLSEVLQEVEVCPAKTATSAISTISPKIAKKMGEIAVFAKIN